MTELDSLISNLTTPEGNSIVLQSLEHMPESTEPAPRRKRRKAQAAPEPQLAAEVLADEVLPDATAARAPEQTVPELGAAATPELAVTEAHPDGANSALPEPEASLRAQSARKVSCSSSLRRYKAKRQWWQRRPISRQQRRPISRQQCRPISRQQCRPIRRWQRRRLSLRSRWQSPTRA